MTTSDSDLVRRAAAGDDGAFDELVSRHRARAYHLALGKVGDREAALDLAQEAFVRAYMSLATLREPASFGAWLAGIVLNVSRMHLRHGSEIALPAEAIEAMNGRDREPSEGDLDAAVARTALGGLPNGTRAAAMLFFVGGMKQSEIAEYLGISLPAVKARIRDARSRLQKEMIDVVKQTARTDEPGDEFNASLAHKLELARWYREFSEMIANGVNLMRTFSRLSEMDFSEPIRQATKKLMDEVGAGSTMYDALANQPALLTPQALVLVRSGEIGGILDWSSRILADLVDTQTAQRDIEVSVWCQTIAGMLSAGVPILHTMSFGIEIAQSKALRQATKDMIEAMKARQSLQSVMDKYADLFPPILRAAVIAGERSATLDYALNWAGGEIAADVARRLAPREFCLPHWMEKGEYLKWERNFQAAVADLVSDESGGIRGAAATILGRTRAQSAAVRVLGLLADEDANTRKAAIESIAALRYDGAARELAARLSDPEVAVRQAAARAIGELQLHGAAPELAQALGEEDLRVPNDAARAFEAMGDDGLLARYAGALVANPVGFDILVRHPAPVVVDALVKALDDSGRDVARSAALALAQLGRADGVPTLLRALDEPDMWRFEEAASALARLGRKEAIPALLRVLAYPHAGIPRTRAARTLVETKDPSAAPAIRQAISEGRLDASHASLAEELESE